MLFMFLFQGCDIDFIDSVLPAPEVFSKGICSNSLIGFFIWNVEHCLAIDVEIKVQINHPMLLC